MAGTALLVDKIAGAMLKNGVTVQAWLSHFVIAPPLIITKEEIDIGVGALDEALAFADSELA